MKPFHEELPKSPDELLHIFHFLPLLPTFSCKRRGRKKIYSSFSTVTTREDNISSEEVSKHRYNRKMKTLFIGSKKMPTKKGKRMNLWKRFVLTWSSFSDFLSPIIDLTHFPEAPIWVQLFDFSRFQPQILTPQKGLFFLFFFKYPK